MIKQSLKIQEFITIAKSIEDKLDKLLIQKEREDKIQGVLVHYIDISTVNMNEEQQYLDAVRNALNGISKQGFLQIFHAVRTGETRTEVFLTSDTDFNKEDIDKEISNLNLNCCDKNADFKSCKCNKQYCEEHGYPPCPCTV
tara:strand:- start:647 stop:1072 length:426 start_codon:yes stop_codon:yes gene_type:complete